MASATRDRVKQGDPPLVLNGPASRRLPLRILFIHSDAADVELCVRELNRARFNVSADVVLAPDQFAGRLNSKYYDVLAEYPEWQKHYRDALLELSPQKLVGRVNEAERAILSRLQEMRIGPDSRVEAQAIDDALNSLRVLKNETAKFTRPDHAGGCYNAIGAESD